VGWDIASTRRETGWPIGDRWWDIAWVSFTIANLAAMALFPEWETVPFHFIWVSLTVLYGFRVWKTRPTLGMLAVVMGTTGFFIAVEYRRGFQPLDELTEVPLMAAMFIAMVWHARRRLTAMEEAERMSMENLKLLERERQFVQDASHELRTPITVALGHTELIERHATDPTVVEDAEIIADELLRLRRLVNGLLLLAGTGDPQQLHRAPVDVRDLAADAVHRWAAQPRRWSFQASHQAIIVGDADRLGVALDALIENAVQYTREGDLIEIRVTERGDRVEISVRDTGQGIRSQDLGRIFDRFARADPSRSRHTGGFGLGLSIVRAIVEAHGGAVGVESRTGRGSTFRMELPAIVDHGPISDAADPDAVITIPGVDDASTAPEGVS
jgi:signal transduction histidine kinase